MAIRWTEGEQAGQVEPQPSTPSVVMGTGLTREGFINAVRDLAVVRVEPTGHDKTLRDAKLVYGAGNGSYRGVCFYDGWKNGTPHAFIEIAASGEESPTQLAGTTLHELGHALAYAIEKGLNVGHGGAWKDACALLGLNAHSASGQAYEPSDFNTDLWASIVALGEPSDGAPNFSGMPAYLGGLVAGNVRPCPMGRGSRGGKTGGRGSGSRLRLWECRCTAPVKVRVASDNFQATCKLCGTDFARIESEVQING